MDSTKQPDTTRRGRPRSEKNRQAICAATLWIVREEGFSKLSMERIASTANVGKQTLYRWWKTPADIVFEALLATTQEADLFLPTSGRPEDLVAWLTALFTLLNDHTGDIVRGLMAEAQFDARFNQAFWEGFIEPRRQMLASLLHQGVRNNQLPPTCDQDVVVDMIFGALWYHLLTRRPLDRAFAVQLVAQTCV